MNGIVFDIKEMAVHDGPGLRTTVFFKGCPLRCIWCHNPEGLSPNPQLSRREANCTHCGLCRNGCNHPDCQPYGRCLHVCPQGLLSVVGKRYTPTELADRILQDAPLFQGGGVTFSGGEPLLQGEFLLKTAALLPGIHKALETGGHAPAPLFQKVAREMDLVYLDVKLADDGLHQKYTGVSNRQILQNLEFLKTAAIPCIIRTPLIPAITDTPENLTAIQQLIGDLPWEQLPYNPLAGAKYPLFGMEYKFKSGVQK